jgi:hypothetical protein
VEGHQTSATVEHCRFEQANGRGGTLRGYPGSFAPGFDYLALAVPAITLIGAETVLCAHDSIFIPWASSQGGATGPGFCTNQYMIDVSATSGGHSLTNNHFHSNPLDPRPAVVPQADLYVSKQFRDQWFLDPGQGDAALQLLMSCTLAGNDGDGYLMYQDASNYYYPCSMNLRLEGNAMAPTGTSLAISFVNPEAYSPILPGVFGPSSQGFYEVAADFGWPAGAYSVSEQSPLGFTIDWTTPFTQGIGTPTISWTAAFKYP